MSTMDDRAYFAKRAQQEREIAARSEDNAVVLAHLRLAEAYERRTRDLAQRADTHSVRISAVERAVPA